MSRRKSSGGIFEEFFSEAVQEIARGVAGKIREAYVGKPATTPSGELVALKNENAKLRSITQKLIRAAEERSRREAPPTEEEKAFRILGVSPGDSVDLIESVYRAKARHLHPDRGGDADAFKDLEAAHRVVLAVVRKRGA